MFFYVFVYLKRNSERNLPPYSRSDMVDEFYRMECRLDEGDGIQRVNGVVGVVGEIRLNTKGENPKASFLGDQAAFMFKCSNTLLSGYRG
jgi:hypothetical protein